MAPNGGGELVVSRGRCRFGRFDLSRIPGAKRVSALRLQLQAWSPFVEPEFAVAWLESGWAMVWCWDAGALRSSLESSSYNRAMRCIPEAALRSRGADGLRLIRVLDGFEAQHWGDGELLASRWWGGHPTSADLVNFQRDCSVSPDSIASTLTAEDLPLLERPWASLVSAEASRGDVSPQERLFYAVAVLVLAIPALALAVDHIRLAQAQYSMSQQIQAADERAHGVLAQREAAMLAAEQLRALAELQPYPQPLVHMAAIARALPSSSPASLREWELADGRLRVLFAVPEGEIAGGELVRALEETGLFSDVKILAQGDPKQMAFSMQIKRQSELVLSPAAASAPEVR